MKATKRWEASAEKERKMPDKRRDGSPRPKNLENVACLKCGKEFERLRFSSMCCCSKECWDSFEGGNK